MGNVFERTEKKYILNASQRQFIEAELRTRMTPDSHGESTIRNIYYDTNDFRLARHSIEKPLYKEKLRVRSYKKVTGEEKVFVELKKKYKGVVYKRRTTMPEKNSIPFLTSEERRESEYNQIQKEIRYFCEMYPGIRPQVFLSYDRTAYFGVNDPDLRISFDTNILWRTTNLSLTKSPGGRSILEEGMSIMEIKAAGAMPLWLVDILNRAEAVKTSFSKYGTAYQTMLLEGSLVFLNNLKSKTRIPAERVLTGKEITAYA